MDERRKFKRWDAEKICVKDENEVLKLVKNMSNTGALILSQKPFKLKSNIKLEFSLSNLKTPMEGLVTRCEEYKEGNYGVGIEFLNLDEQTKAIRDDILLSLLYHKHSVSWK